MLERGNWSLSFSTSSMHPLERILAVIIVSEMEQIEPVAELAKRPGLPSTSQTAHGERRPHDRPPLDSRFRLESRGCLLRRGSGYAGLDSSQGTGGRNRLWPSDARGTHLLDP